jgi:prepilin-type N-terminal cleavage/methylation domain-containing protein
MEMKSSHRSLHLRSQSGMTLIETVVALVILLIVSIGVTTIAVVATQTTENQGNLGARTAEYAQDKLEQLISLSYADNNTDTTVFPACSATSITPPACSTGTGLTVGGSSDPNNPVSTPGHGYVDYLDVNGNPLTSSTNWYYIRVWQISTPAGTTNLKQITVTCAVRNGIGNTGNGGGALPQSTVTTFKTCISVSGTCW